MINNIDIYQIMRNIFSINFILAQAFCVLSQILIITILPIRAVQINFFSSINDTFLYFFFQCVCSSANCNLVFLCAFVRGAFLSSFFHCRCLHCFRTRRTFLIFVFIPAASAICLAAIDEFDAALRIVLFAST